ncbi:MAG: recombinase RecT, partial [Acidobacteria bacterium]|nr:recombinase RecT [Acidobacteriota bacterium]
MSTGLQTEPKLSQLIVREDTHDRIVAAIGDTMPAEQFISHALVAFQAPEVRKCTPRSQLVAFMELAALGLLPTLNQAKLIPYKDEIKVMPQWQGFKALMERNKAVLEVQAFLVHVLDQFTYTARDGTLHVMDPFNPERQFRGPKDIRGGYLRITYRDGRPPRYHFVPVAQIEKCRGCAQTQNVWTKWYEQMALKTIYRDGYARRAVPMDPLVAGRMEKLLEADDALLGNDPARIETTPLVDRIRRQREAAQNPAGPQTTDGHGAVENDADTEAANGPSGTTPP